MRNIFLITRREYLTQVRKKSFIILTLLSPFLIILLGVFIGYVIKGNSAETHIQVIDKSGVYASKLKSNETVFYHILPLAEENKAKNELKNSETTDGVLIIYPIKQNNFTEHEEKTELLIQDKINFETKIKIENDLSEILRSEKAKHMNLDEEQLKELEQDFNLKSWNINNENTNTDLDFGVKFGLGMILMYATAMFILIYGVRVMRSVLEEKNNRVVEIIISSVKPFELMMGKILGVTLVAITQFAVWITMTIAGAFFLNMKFTSPKKTISQNQSDIIQPFDIQKTAGEIAHILLDMNVPLVVFGFLLFFLFGYIFYSSMYAAIGSAVDNETETQQFSLFAVIPLTIGMYGSFSIINNPDGPLGIWLSIIPFTSPVAMAARIPFGVPLWQIFLSMGLLIASALFMVFIAAKIYRVGILSYGNKATFKELWKWIRY